MRRSMAAGVLSLALLAGCAPARPPVLETAPGTRSRPEVWGLSKAWGPRTTPKGTMQALGLGPGEFLRDWAVGDLNGDGEEDFAAVVEHRAPEGYWFSPEPRPLQILLGDGSGGYRRGPRGDYVLRKANEGGMWGDPYEGIAIVPEGLVTTMYGGSSGRWRETCTFAWTGDDLAFRRLFVESYSTHTGEGFTYDYDLQNGTCQRWSYGEAEGFVPALLYEGPCLTPDWTLSTAPEDWLWDTDFSQEPPWPDWNQDLVPRAERDYEGKLRFGAEEILDQMQKRYHPNMWRVDYPYTEETYQNWCQGLGYAAPRYYYTDGKGELSYFLVEYDGYYERYKHTVMYQEDGEHYDFYWIWDDTGAERDFQNDRPAA